MEDIVIVSKGKNFCNKTMVITNKGSVLPKMLRKVLIVTGILGIGLGLIANLAYSAEEKKVQKEILSEGYIKKEILFLSWGEVGLWITEWQLQGVITNTERYGPPKIEVDKEDNIFIFDGINQRIQKYSKEGNFLTSISLINIKGEPSIDVFAGTHQCEVYRIYGEKYDIAGIKIKDSSGKLLGKAKIEFDPAYIEPLGADREGNVYLLLDYTFIESPKEWRLEVYKYNKKGNLLAKIELSTDINYTNWIYRSDCTYREGEKDKVRVDKDGNIYQLLSKKEGAYIIKWEVKSPKQESPLIKEHKSEPENLPTENLIATNRRRTIASHGFLRIEKDKNNHFIYVGKYVIDLKYGTTEYEDLNELVEWRLYDEAIIFHKEMEQQKYRRLKEILSSVDKKILRLLTEGGLAEEYENMSDEERKYYNMGYELKYWPPSFLNDPEMYYKELQKKKQELEKTIAVWSLPKDIYPEVIELETDLNNDGETEYCIVYLKKNIFLTNSVRGPVGEQYIRFFRLKPERVLLGEFRLGDYQSAGLNVLDMGNRKVLFIQTNDGGPAGGGTGWLFSIDENDNPYQVAEGTGLYFYASAGHYNDYKIYEEEKQIVTRGGEAEPSEDKIQYKEIRRIYKWNGKDFELKDEETEIISDTEIKPIDMNPSEDSEK